MLVLTVMELVFNYTDLQSAFVLVGYTFLSESELFLFLNHGPIRILIFVRVFDYPGSFRLFVSR